MSIVSDNNKEKKPFTGLPFHFKRDASTEQPIEKEDKGNGILRWGQDNLYPQWLNGLFYSSAIHSGIIRSKVFFTTSGGLNYEGADQEKWSRMFDNGTSNYNLDEVVTQMAMDLELSNMVVLRGRWSIDKSHCSRIDLVPFETVRQMIDCEDIAVCPDWSDKKRGFIVYKPLDAFDKESFHFYLMYKAKPKQMILQGQKKVMSGMYPLAPYIGAIKSIQTDAEIVNYQHSEIVNNFSLGTIINLNNGKPKTREDRLKLEKRIKDAQGTDSAGGTVVLFNNGKDNATTVEKLSGNDLNNRYQTLSEDVRRNILLGHSVTSTTLFGLEAGGNFNASEMEIGYEIMKKNYFDAARRVLLSLIQRVATECNGITGEISFNEVELTTTQPEQPQFKASEEKKEDRDDTAYFIGEFEKIGRDKTDVVILSHQAANVEDLEGSELQLMEDFRKNNFALQSNTVNILSMIQKGDSFDAISQALEMNPADLAKIYSQLQKGEYLDNDMKVTRKGLIELANNDASRMSIVYSYEVRPELGEAEVIDGTRDFCRELIRLNRVYTRAEIDSIPSPNQGEPNSSVWYYKGGWYNTGTKSVPYCRHYWKQQIIFE